MIDSPSKPKRSYKSFHWVVFRQPTAWLLVAVNLAPVMGIHFWGWDLFSLMFLYWCETWILWFVQYLRAILILGWAAVSKGIILTTLIFAFFMTFSFLFIYGVLGQSRGHLVIVSSSPNHLGFGPADSAQAHRHLFDFLFETIMRERLWVGLALLLALHGMAFLLFLVKKLRTKRTTGAVRVVKPEKKGYRPTEDWQSVMDPSTQSMSDIKSRYQGPTRETKEEVEIRRSKNFAEAWWLILSEPFKRMGFLFLTVMGGFMMGSLVPIFLSLLVGRVLVEEFHFDLWILSALIFFKIYFDLYYRGKHAAVRQERQEIGAGTVD